MSLGHAGKVRSGEITELRDYALLCLRTWRFPDEIEIAYDLVTAEEQPNPYYSRKLAEAQSRLAALKAMSDKDASKHSRNAHEQAHAAWSGWTKEWQARRERTEKMLAKLESWRPPTADLVELKHFMRGELEAALAHEAAEAEHPKPSRATARKHLAEGLQRAERDVGYYANKVEAEAARVAEENQRVRALIESL